MFRNYTRKLLQKNIFQQNRSFQSLRKQTQSREHAFALLKAKRRLFNWNFSQIMSNQTPQWIHANTLSEYIKILGKQKGEECQAYIDERVRVNSMAYELVQKMAEEKAVLKRYTHTLSKLIVGRTGMGECDEQTNYCFSLSHARGRSDIAKVRLHMGTGPEGQIYPHLFLLLGEISHEELSSLLCSQDGALNNLDKLPDHITILDPLINCVYQANDWENSPLNKYINAHQQALNSGAVIKAVGKDMNANQDVYMDLMMTAEEIYNQHFEDDFAPSHSRSNSI